MNGSIYKSEHITSIFHYIENNLSFDLDTKILSDIGYTSHSQLYRTFYNLTGHSVKEYIRKRRLSNALAMIKASHFSLTDIAMRCGYSSHQALCRVIRQTLGLTPSEYKNGNTYYFFPPFSGEPLQSITVSNESIPHSLCVSFYHSSMINIENLAVNTFLKAVPDYIGRIFGRNGKREGRKFCYELYLTDTNRNYDILNSYGFKKGHNTPIFTTTFAVSTVQNDEQIINTSWDYLSSRWLQNSMFEYSNKPYYEEYIIKNNIPVKLKLYFPVKKRTEETKITLINNPRLYFIVAKAKGYNAEKIASKMVIDYLTAHYKQIVMMPKEFYLHKETNLYICGVRLNASIWIESIENVEGIFTDQNYYLMLKSNVIGDYDQYADMLLSFAQENGMIADKKKIFAVYDARNSFNNLKIKMYCPIQIGTK